MGTVAGAGTRRYHGHLVAALRPPVQRHLLLSKLHEAIVVDGAEHAPLHRPVPGDPRPRASGRIQEFLLDPFPTWTFEAGGVRLRSGSSSSAGKTPSWSGTGRAARAGSGFGVFLAYRDYHALSHANGALDGTVREEGQTVRLRPYADCPSSGSTTAARASNAAATGTSRTEYLAELERGLDFQEDLGAPARSSSTCRPAARAFVAATLGDRRIDATVVETLESAERDRRRTPYADPLTARLSVAADHYLVRRADEIQSTRRSRLDIRGPLGGEIRIRRGEATSTVGAPWGAASPRSSRATRGSPTGGATP